MLLSEGDKNSQKEMYLERFEKYGYSPASLGWSKGKQDIRFDILTSFYEFDNKSILDIGCGFGDLNKTLKKKCTNYEYTGIDLINDFIGIGKELYGSQNISFEVGDFLAKNFDKRFDYAMASGIFNYKFKDGNNYEFIENVIKKSLDICNDGVAFDFLSDKVNYCFDYNFHSSPEKILEIGYKYSRNIILRNDYMPFEFSIFIFKDDSFTDDSVFRRYKSESVKNLE